MTASTKDLIDRARDAARIAPNAAFLRELADALERLTQPVGVEPVAEVVGTPCLELPLLKWLSADHSLKTAIGTQLVPIETVARLQAELKESERLRELSNATVTMYEAMRGAPVNNFDELGFEAKYITEAHLLQEVRRIIAERDAAISLRTKYFSEMCAVIEKNDILQEQVKALRTSLDGMLQVFGVRECHMNAYTDTTQIEVDCCNEARSALAETEPKEKT